LFKNFKRHTISLVALLTVSVVADRTWSAATVPAATGRNTLFPKLYAGQTLTYLVRYHTQKNVKIESRVVTASGPQNAQTDAQWILHLEILNVHPQGERAAIRARTQLQSVDPGESPRTPSGEQTPSGTNLGPSAKLVEFTILPDGRADSVTGLDALFAEQREAWQQWLRQFSIAAVFPRGGVKRGQTWKSTEPEQAPSPIVKLEWGKVATYVRDEPCAAVQMAETGVVTPGNSQSESCAVVLTRAALKQKSSPKDTTPGDFRLHALRTTGNASGTNETISYISLQSGLVMRVTEDTKQFMDVIIAKVDGSNQVHYNVDASSHTEVLLVTTAAASSLSPKP
jgi:hypothetical protein